MWRWCIENGSGVPRRRPRVSRRLQRAALRRRRTWRACTHLGCLESRVPGYVRGAVQTLNDQGDDKVYSHVFPYVAGGHPVAKVQSDMADQLVEVILEAMPELSTD